MYARLCRRHSDQAPAGACRCNRPTMKHRLIEQACSNCCYTVRGQVEEEADFKYLLSSLPPALRPGTCKYLSLQRSRHKAPTDRARLRRLHDVRRSRRRSPTGIVAGIKKGYDYSTFRGGGGLNASARARVLVTTRTRGTRHLQDGVCLCKSIEQACCVRRGGCGGGGSLKVCARLCRWHSDQAPAGVCRCNGAAMRLGLIEQACDCSTPARRSRRRPQGVCSSLPPALRPGTCRSLPLQRSRQHEALKNRSCERLRDAS